MMGYVYAFLIGMLTTFGVEMAVIVAIAAGDWYKKRKRKDD